MAVSIGQYQRLLLLYVHNRNCTINQDFFLLRVLHGDVAYGVEREAAM